MNRRELLTHISLLLGGSLSPHIVNAALNNGDTGPKLHHHAQVAGSSSNNSNYILRTLSEEQNALVVLIVERIIPKTDSAGAKEAKVNEFIDLMLTDWYPIDEKKEILLGLENFDLNCRKMYGKGFPNISEENRHAYLTLLDREAVLARKDRIAPLPFFATIKELTLVGYFTSEAGMTQALNFHGPLGEFNFGVSGPPGGLVRF